MYVRPVLYAQLLAPHLDNTPADLLVLHICIVSFLQPNKVANCVFTPLVSALVGGSLECMKLLIQVMPHCIVLY